jgi:hypothetical protein
VPSEESAEVMEDWVEALVVMAAQMGSGGLGFVGA